jgi:hypothetical protein
MATGTTRQTNPNATPFVENLSGDDMTKFMRSQNNQEAVAGAGATSTGTQTTQSGLGALGPVLAQLSGLVKGDQADISQATQPAANQIKDSFAAIRNMISQQPRGGGKAGVLAEAPYKAATAVGDMQQKARTDATGQLGGLSMQLAGLGVNEQELGLQATQDAASNNLARRNQDMTSGSFASQFGNIAGGIAGMTGAVAGSGGLY